MRGYRRRPLLEGNVQLPVLAQPTIRAAVAKNTTTGEIPALTVPCELVLTTEGGDATILITTASLAGMVTEINATIFPTIGRAQEVDGTLVLTTVGAGESAFLRIGRVTSGLPDAAEMLGLPRDPDPLATVRGGDLLTTPLRPALQDNPEGAGFLAQGEDRSSAAFNRALSALARNGDTLYTQLNGAVARGVTVVVDGTWSSRLVTNADGSIDAIDLTDLDEVVPGLSGRLWVGDLTNASTLADIAQYWRVTDYEGRELLAWDASASEPRRAVRVGAVTYGPRVGARPVFADEVSAPIPVLADDATGFNALGNDVLRVGPTQITAIERGVLLRCDSLGVGTGFATYGVVAGDLLDITDSTINVPYNHNGTYLVEAVLSENELLVRPISSGDVDGLHTDDGADDFGQVTVRSGGGWASHQSESGPGIYLTFDPPLPRLPSDGIRLSFGIEVALGALLDGDLLAPAGSAVPEAAAFVVRQLWHKQSLGGVYQGMSGERAGGFFADVDGRPFTLRVTGSTTPSEGVLAAGPYTGSIADNVLTADPTHTFTLEDVGRIVTVSVSSSPDEMPCIVTEWIDNAHVVLTLPDGAALSAASVLYNVYEFAVRTLGAGVHLVSPSENDGDAVRTPGLVFTREHQDDTTTDPVVPGTSFLHLERVTLVGDGTGAQTNRQTFEITALTTGTPSTVVVPFDPEATGNLFAEEGGDTRPAAAAGWRPSTLLHIVNGPNAGLYRIVATTRSSGSGTNGLSLRHLDGRDVTFAAFADPTYAALYNVHAGVGVSLADGSGTVGVRTAQVAVFFDATAAGEDAGTGLSLNWRGVGAGIRANLNDAGFSTLADGEGASGYLIDALLYAPAHGINLSVAAPDTGTEAERSARGVTVKVAGYQMGAVPELVNILTGTPLSSWGAWVHQAGTDPGLVLTSRLPTGTTAPVDAADLFYPTGAALLLRTTSPAVMGVGGAIDLTGSLYQRQVSEPFEGDFAGALYTETGLGAGYWMHPLHPFSRNPNPAGAYGYDSSGFPTELGSPDQVYPRTTAETAPIGTILPPNSDLFPFHHTGVIGQDASTLLIFELGRIGTTRIVGKTVYLTGAAGFDGWYTIVGISTEGGATNLRIAVTAYNTTTPWAPASGVTGSFRIYGKRWHQSHLSIADYALLGTWDATADNTDLPLLGAMGDEVGTLRTASSYAGAVSTTGGLLGPVSWAPVTDGTALGLALDDTTDMAHVHVSASAYASYAGWRGLVYVHGWAADTDEPRSPFPNTGVVTYLSNPASALFALGYPGNLGLDDVAVDNLSGTSLVRWSGPFGGCLWLNAITASSLRVWQRGRTHVHSAHTAVRVRMRVARSSGSGTQSYVIALRRSDGTVLTSRTVSRSSTTTLVDIEAELTYDGLARGAADAFPASQEALPLHVTVDVTLGNASSAYIVELRSEPMTRPAVVSGPQLVAGTQLAHGYRFTDPVRGFQTRGPADVRLLGGTDYARNESWEVLSSVPGHRAYVTGTQEQRSGPGLLRLNSQAVVDAWIASNPAGYGASLVTQLAELVDLLLNTFDSNGEYEGGDTIPGFDNTDDRVLAVVDAIAALDAVTTLSAATEALEFILSELQSIADACIAFTSESSSLEANVNAYGEALDAYLDTLSVSDLTDGMLDPPVDGWIRPWVDGYRLFTQGVHSAQVSLYSPAFDPLWYAYCASRFAPDPDAPVDVSTFVLPGMTGFVLPLDPPHGALLTTLDLGLSFRAQSADHWGIYAGHPTPFDILAAPIPNSLGPIKLALLESKADWDALAGVRVELWRYNAVDFDVAEDDRAGWSEHEPEFGFGERIAEWTIDLSDVSPPSETANPVTGMGSWETVYAGKEHFERRHWALTSGVPGDAGNQVLRVDRRHYTYALVVRFYGGMRQLAGSDKYVPHTRFQGTAGTVANEQAWETPQAIVSSGVTFYAHKDAAYAGSGTNQDWGDTASFPPAVKFRGARLGWVTDRASDGGW